MKAIVLPLLIATASLSLGISIIHAAPSAVSLRVEQTNKSDMDAKDRAARTSSQTHSLKLYLTNSSANPADLKVKYTYFGRDMANHSIVSISSGEQAVTIKPNGLETADLPPVTSKYTEEHYEKGKPPKKVEASGARFIGYAVQVFVGDQMAAEAYEPLSVKDEVGKAAPAAAGGAKPAGKPAATPKK